MLLAIPMGQEFAVYNPKHFVEKDRSLILATMRSQGAELITYGKSGLQASIVPVIVDDNVTTLRGHLARANQQWRDVDVSVPVLVTWRGPEAYISPSFYPSKAEDGRVVPTWNYTTVQVRGVLEIHDDADWVEGLVRSLTSFHEGRFEEPWSVDDAPRDYVESMLRAVVGFEVQVTDVEAKWKMSQNRSDGDIAGVIDGLQRQGSPTALEVADTVGSIRRP